MPDTVTTLNQVLSLTGVTSIAVTAVVSDGEGGFVRSFRFFGSGGSGVPPVLEVKVDATLAASIDVTTPPLSF